MQWLTLGNQQNQRAAAITAIAPDLNNQSVVVS